MSDAGVASRRHAEEMIEEGRVKVNGKVVRTLPVLIDPQADSVYVDGRPMRMRPQEFVYVMLNKPKDTVTTSDDPNGRRTVTELVNHPSKARLYPVGRLDFDTTGLLLLTNDGDLANKLTHPRFGVHKTYLATVRGILTQDAVDELEKGIVFANRKQGRTVGAIRTGGAKLSFVRRGQPARRGGGVEGEVNTTVLRITLSEGRNRQVRRMLAQAGCRVKRLVRIKMGPIELTGLKPGQWRDLTRQEVAMLRRLAESAERREPKGLVQKIDKPAERPSLRELAGRPAPERPRSASPARGARPTKKPFTKRR